MQKRDHERERRGRQRDGGKEARGEGISRVLFFVCFGEDLLCKCNSHTTGWYLVSRIAGRGQAKASEEA